MDAISGFPTPMMYNSRAGPAVDKLIEQKDENGDGLLSPTEFGVPEEIFNKIDANADGQLDKDELIRKRDKTVPLKGGMGDAWDTAYASLFLASDEARFITSVTLAVDGGQSARIG